MGQKVSPIGYRVGITQDWLSRWYAPKAAYGGFLIEDEKIRRFVDKKLNRQPPYAAVSKIEIERTREEIKVMIHTARPGLVIGPKGGEVDKLKEELEDLTDRRVNVTVHEVRNPDLNAKLVGEAVAEQLMRRAAFRRTMKQRAEAAMAAGALGVKIQCSGRLGGAEMKRTETAILGSIPLQRLQANIDYALSQAYCTYGVIGVKVWIYLGSFGEPVVEESGDGAHAKARQVSKAAKGPHSREGDSR
jgi:small subunit ribosomal protein S3